MDRHEHRERGLLLVETNGTTDAEELVTLLAADPRLHDFSLPFQISVVDVKRWQKRFWHNGLESDQLQTASVIYFGHTDEVDEGRMAAVLESLSRKKAPLPALTQEELADELARLAEEGSRQEVRVPCGEGSACGHDHSEEGAHHHGHQHSEERHHFAANEILLPSVVRRERFEAALKTLPEEILRVKGLVRFEEEPGSLHIFQKIGKFDAVQTAPLDGEPVTDQPVAVFIGSRIDAEFPQEFLKAIS
jgi:G3E family GTPase